MLGLSAITLDFKQSCLFPLPQHEIYCMWWIKHLPPPKAPPSREAAAASCLGWAPPPFSINARKSTPANSAFSQCKTVQSMQFAGGGTLLQMKSSIGCFFMHGLGISFFWVQILWSRLFMLGRAHPTAEAAVLCLSSALSPPCQQHAHYFLGLGGWPADWGNPVLSLTVQKKTHSPTPKKPRQKFKCLFLFCFFPPVLFPDSQWK